MKLTDLNEAEQEVSISDPTFRPGFNTNSSMINGSTISPLLRKALGKLANNTRLQRVEQQLVIQAFTELLRMEPNKIVTPLRAMQKVVNQARPRNENQ